MSDCPRLVHTAMLLAEVAHFGQFRRDGDTPYSIHCHDVASRVSGEPPEVVATAWLHDVLEDSPLTAKDLSDEGIPPVVVEAVQALTKTPGEPYPSYLARVKANPIARKVKEADMQANLEDAPTQAQIRRYLDGLCFLRGES